MKMKAPRRLGVSDRHALLQRAATLFNEQCAIAVLANLPQRLAPEERREQMAALESQKTGDLRCFVKLLRANVDGMRSEFGLKLDQVRLLALVDQIQHSTARNQAAYVPVWKLSKWLSKYDTMPPHWRVSIDPHCIGRNYPGGFEVRTPEMTMFEDMAALFNMAHEAHMEIVAGRKNSKVELKRAFALYRSVVSTAFYFIESFMNGLAADYVWRHRGEIGANELSLLTEWNQKKNRPSTVTTREKLVRYPRILTRSEYPPLHEDNCEELRLL